MEQERIEFKYFTLLAGLFIGTLLISNTVAQKPLQLGPLVPPAAIILFPLTYIFGDVLTEVYGYARTRQVIWTGFLASGLMAISYWIVIALPGASFWTQQEALRSVLSPVPRIVLASLVGYLAGEFVNSFVLAKMKLLTQGRYLWTRTIGSTVAGQSVDTTLFVMVAFAGVWPRSQLLSVIVSLYALKVGYEVLATPITYSVVAFLKRTEGIDYYDRQTAFMPFRWKL
jgi:queuosine precursor transporter